MSVRTLPGSKWACRGCAACCSSGFELGPVEDAVIADLEQADIASLWPPAAAGPWYQRRPGRDGRTYAFLSQNAGRCVFLRDDDLCAVHALLGGHRKPGFCQEFPYHVVEEPRGLVAIVRPSCGGLHQTFIDGPSLTPADLSEVVSLPRVYPHRRFAPDAVEVLPGTTVSLDAWLQLEDAAIAAIEAHPHAGPDTAIALVREALVQGTGAEPPAPRPAQAIAGCQAIGMALGKVMQAVLAQGGGPADRAAFAQEAAERLPRAVTALDQPLPPVDAETAAYIHRLLRGQLLAKQWEAWGSVHAGLGQFHLGITMARALSADASLSAFDAPYRHWLRFAANAMIQHVLRSARVALTDVFLHTPRR